VVLNVVTSALKGLNMRRTKAEYIDWMALIIKRSESPCNKQNRREELIKPETQKDLNDYKILCNML
jgi:hypothetical protein